MRKDKDTMNILVVDDELTALKHLIRVLNKIVPDAGIYQADETEDALTLCHRHVIDVVFLDIVMPDQSGLVLAREIKKIRPLCNVVLVTAHSQYALDALRLYVSDYILKPASRADVRQALANLRYPVREERKGLYVQCFGNFEVFYDGKAVHFGRAKVKEMFAYLIDRRGAAVTNSALRAILWGDKADGSEKQMHYFAQIVYELRARLSELGCLDVFLQSRDSYAIIPEKIPCDYYMALQKDTKGLEGFNGEYMSQYDWAERRIGLLMRQIEKEKRE